MSYINEIKKGNTTYDINDKRIPEVSASDSGQVLGIDDGGNIVQTPLALIMPSFLITRNDNSVFGITKVYTEPFKQYLSDMNDIIQQLASLLSITIPDVISVNTANNAFTQLLPYINANTQLRYTIFNFLLNIEKGCLKAIFFPNAATNTPATLIQAFDDDVSINTYFLNGTSGTLTAVKDSPIVADILANGNMESIILFLRYI